MINLCFICSSCRSKAYRLCRVHGRLLELFVHKRGVAELVLAEELGPLLNFAFISKPNLIKSTQLTMNVPHTADVVLPESLIHSASNTSRQAQFDDLLLSPAVLRGVSAAGLASPSPVQMAAVPLGRLGIDLIAQAKSGTGKTLVFVLVALEALDASAATPQVLVLTPTREIAVQVADVIRRVGQYVEGLACATFVGGVPLAIDESTLRRRCNVAVGTPGRIRQLIERKALQTSDISLLVLDEADRLVDSTFFEQTRWLAQTLPNSRQTLAFSATFTDEVLSV